MKISVLEARLSSIKVGTVESVEIASDFPVRVVMLVGVFKVEEWPAATIQIIKTLKKFRSTLKALLF